MKVNRPFFLSLLIGSIFFVAPIAIGYIAPAEKTIALYSCPGDTLPPVTETELVMNGVYQLYNFPDSIRLGATPKMRLMSVSDDNEFRLGQI